MQNISSAGSFRFATEKKTDEDVGLTVKGEDFVIASSEHNGMVCVGCVPHQRATKDSCCSHNFTLDSSKRCLCCDQVMIK